MRKLVNYYIPINESHQEPDENILVGSKYPDQVDGDLENKQNLKFADQARMSLYCGKRNKGAVSTLKTIFYSERKKKFKCLGPNTGSSVYFA